MVREGGMAKHGEEVLEGMERVGMGGNECGPCHDIGRGDSGEEGESVGREVGFEILGYEVVE